MEEIMNRLISEIKNMEEDENLRVHISKDRMVLVVKGADDYGVKVIEPGFYNMACSVRFTDASQVLSYIDLMKNAHDTRAMNIVM